MAGIFLINPLLSEELELNLVELAVFVSEANNKNILVDESLRGENIVFIINDKQDFFLEAFEKALNLKGLELIKNDKFYFVKKPDDFLEIEKYRTIKLNFVKFEDIENLLKLYDLKYEFIKSSKILAIKSKETDFNSLSALITEIDKYPNQLKLKITIIETKQKDLTKANEYFSEVESKGIKNAAVFLIDYQTMEVLAQVGSVDFHNKKILVDKYQKIAYTNNRFSIILFHRQYFV